MEEVKRILVVSRMSKDSAKAVHYGVSLCRKYGAELYVVDVIHDPLLLGGWNLPIPAIEESFREAREEAKAEMDSIINREKRAGMTVKEFIREGDPAEDVCKLVEEEKIDLLIMIAHEEGRLEHLLFGRSNDDIIRRMPCSILLVKKEPEPVMSYEDEGKESEW
jgi:universal stress protein A